MPLLSQIFDRHVFVDLETTGLDPAVDEVIELGAVFVEDGVPVRRISKLFSASSPLPLAIHRLTGLSDADLAGQPRFASFEDELARALSGYTVVAHNAAFEQSFLADVLERVQAPVLDSCEVLHYLFPELESHSLEAAIRWAKVGTKAAHRALQDCEDTFAVLAHAISLCEGGARADDLADLLLCLDPSSGELQLAQREAGEALDEDDDPSPVVRLLRALHRHALAHPPPLELKPVDRFLPARAERRRSGPAPKRPESDEQPVAPDHRRGSPGGARAEGRARSERRGVRRPAAAARDGRPRSPSCSPRARRSRSRPAPAPASRSGTSRRPRCSRPATAGGWGSRPTPRRCRTS